MLGIARSELISSTAVGAAGPVAAAAVAGAAASCKVLPAPSGSLAALHRHRRSAGWWQRAGNASGGNAAVAAAPRRRGTAVHVAAVSTPERVTVTERSPPRPPAEVEVKVIGIGSRGANAISKLLQHGKVNNAELWCLDVDKASLDAVPTGINTLLLPKADPTPPGASALAGEGKLEVEDLQRIIGRTASDAGGRGNINAGTDGAVTFVLAPAAAAPGGAATVLQIVGALRAAGHFTVAAVTQPFGFEGHAKQEQANELIAALQQTAHKVAVMEQDVLMQAFGEAQMTVAQATDIADNALEHTVCCILQAVQAQEILKSSRGALMWHGRDLSHFKRIISPPLQQLLMQPGTAVLGRGLASMPAEAAHQMGAAQALMHLASDAVRAAGESPFLDSALDGACGLLCSISLPAIDQEFAIGPGGTAVLQHMQTADGQRRAVHKAAQAAAGALGSMSGPGCQDFMVCAEPRPLGETKGDGSMVEVEATLLVLRAPDGTLPPPGALPPVSGITRRPIFQQQGQQGQYGVGPAVPVAARQQAAAPKRLPASSWKQLSGMAGGTTPAARTPPATSNPADAQQEAAPQEQQAQGAGAPPEQQQRPQRAAPNFFAGGAGSRPQQGVQQQQPAVQPRPAVPATPPAPRSVNGRVPVQRPGTPASARVPPAAGAAPAPTPAQQGAAGTAADPQQQQQQAKMTVSDYLINTLTAQSLDLPPAAAQWRQEHRGDAFKQRKLIVWEVDEVEPWEEEEEPQGLAALLPGRPKEKRVNIKERMASILMQDREDAWEAEQNSWDES